MPKRPYVQKNDGEMPSHIGYSDGVQKRKTKKKIMMKIDNGLDQEEESAPRFLLDSINIGIIEELVNNGDIKSSEIAQKLSIPLSTIQRRRSNLEKLRIVRKNYTVDLKMLNLRIAEVMIGTSKGTSKKILDEIFTKNKLSLIDTSLRVGNPDTNISFRIAYRNSKELFEVLEQIKGMENVYQVSWSEYISEKSNKSSFRDLLMK